jgi:predicted dehydrogenase
LPAGYPLGYYDAILGLLKDFYEAVKAGGKESGRPLPRPTFDTGAEEMRSLEAVVASRCTRTWVKVA